MGQMFWQWISEPDDPIVVVYAIDGTSMTLNHIEHVIGHEQ